MEVQIKNIEKKEDKYIADIYVDDNTFKEVEQYGKKFNLTVNDVLLVGIKSFVEHEHK